MLTLNELRKNRDLINDIDWDMTPKKAGDLYLEKEAGLQCSNDPAAGNYESTFFVLCDGEISPRATLVKRSMKEEVELAEIPVPKDLFVAACGEEGKRLKGTTLPLNDTLKQWLETVLGNAPGMPKH